MKLKPCMFMLRMASQGKTNVCKNIYQGILFIFQIDTGRACCIFHTELICSTSIGRAGHAETTASGGLCDARHCTYPMKSLPSRSCLYPLTRLRSSSIGQCDTAAVSERSLPSGPLQITDRKSTR